MVKAIQIRGFRRFRSFEIGNLKRINLFIGANCSGRTSILEAIEILASGKPGVLLPGPVRRGEEVSLLSEQSAFEVDLSHLWFGHKLIVCSSFEITAKGDRDRFVECSIVEVGNDYGTVMGETAVPPEPAIPKLGIWFRSDSIPPGTLIRLSPSRGLPNDERNRISPAESKERVSYLTTALVDHMRLGKLWDSIALTSDEAIVIEFLRIINPKIQGLAFLGDSRSYGRNTLLSISEFHERIPIGSAGDGLRHLLALSLNVISARHGVLLVDEIDVGLHCSVMQRMWRFLVEIARRLDVQVFATTRSLDCARALAWTKEKLGQVPDDVMIHNIDPQLDHSLACSSDELGAMEANRYREARENG